MELIAPVIVIAVSAAFYLRLLHLRTDALERRFITWGFLANVVGAGAQILVTTEFYGGGDMMVYHRFGLKISELMWFDFWTYFPRVMEIVLGGRPPMPFWVFGAGSSTGTITGLSALIAFATGGSLYAACLLFGFFAFAGQVGIYLAFRSAFSTRQLRRRLLIACFLVPSVVFWSSALLKEPLALGGLGIAILGAANFIRNRRRTLGAILVAAGCTVVFLVKSYILIAFAAAASVWYYWQRAGERRRQRLVARPVYIVIATLVAGTAIYYVGTIDERFAVGNLTDETAHLQRQYYSIAARSTYVLGRSSSDATPERQPYLAPLGLASALFRPVVFEVHNATSLVNAFEMLWITFLFLTILRHRGLRGTLRLTARSPTLMFMVVFVLVLGTGVGLASPNLGSLSRYRIPMMPLWVGTLLILLPIRRSQEGREGPKNR